jgi:hypothetical protein
VHSYNASGESVCIVTVEAFEHRVVMDRDHRHSCSGVVFYNCGGLFSLRIISVHNIYI